MLYLILILVDAALRNLVNEAECVQDDVVLALCKLANIDDIWDFLVFDGPHFAHVRPLMYILFIALLRFDYILGES